MAGKKSRALVAAEKLAVPSAVPSAEPSDEPSASGAPRWSRAQVERALRSFDDIARVPPYDEDGIRRRVVEFLRFADRLELGGIADDALPLAQTLVERGYTWLSQHPRYSPFTHGRWNSEMVEEVVQWFADATAEPLGKRESEEVGRRLRTFSAVVGSGAVESGDAETLAQAFLDHATRWLYRHPDVRAVFVQED